MDRLELPLVIRITAKNYAILVAVTTAFFSVQGLMFIFDLGLSRPPGEAEYVHYIIGISLILIGFTALVLLVLFKNKKEAVEISEDGISFSYSGKFLHWTDIRKVEVGNIKGRQFLFLYISNRSPSEGRAFTHRSDGISLISTWGSGVPLADAKKTIEQLVAENRRI